MTQDRAVVYLRQSTYREESISLELQEQAARTYAARQGYRIVAVEDDPGISGREWAKRPGVNRAMGYIEEGRAEVLLLWKWSRLSRARFDFAMAVQRVEAAGGRVESATEPADTTTSIGRLNRGMLAEFAAFESDRIGDVWKEVHERRLRQGLPHNGAPRFGYIKVGDAYEPDPELGPVLAEMYYRYVELDQGFTAIARWLNQTGVPTARNTLWEAVKVRYVLDSGFGAGHLAIGHQITYKRPSYVPGAQQPVIDAALWEKFLTRRGERSKPSRIVEPVAALSGLLRCGDCGGPMTAYNRHNIQPPVKAWHCRLASTAGDGRRYLSITDARAMSLVKDWVTDLARDVDAQAAAARAVHKQKAATRDLAAANKRKLEKARRGLGTLTVKLIEGKTTQDAYDAVAARYQADIDQALATPDVPESVELNIRQISAHVLGVWGDATPKELNRLISNMVRRIRVVPDPRVRRGPSKPTLDIVPLWDQ